MQKYKMKQKDVLSFEDALKRLESIIASMEQGDTPLDELVTKFEEADKLRKYCDSKLAEAELKIEQLKKNKDNLEFVKFTEDSAE